MPDTEEVLIRSIISFFFSTNTLRKILITSYYNDTSPHSIYILLSPFTISVHPTSCLYQHLRMTNFPTRKATSCHKMRVLLPLGTAWWRLCDGLLQPGLRPPPKKDTLEPVHGTEIRNAGAIKGDHEEKGNSPKSRFPVYGQQQTP